MILAGDEGVLVQIDKDKLNRCTMIVPQKRKIN